MTRLRAWLISLFRRPPAELTDDREFAAVEERRRQLTNELHLIQRKR